MQSSQKYLSDFIEKNHGCSNTIYIIGSGSSLRLFPTDFLADKFTIGLNEAYKSLQFRPTINITIHPRLINDNAGEWITKLKDDVQIKKYYQFWNTEDLESLKPSAAVAAPQTLYCGRGVQTSGLALAARLGASYAVLVGCDMAALGDGHHATPSHVQFHNLNSYDVYKEYYFYTVKVREILEKEYNMKTLYLSPLIGECNRNNDYEYQCWKKGLSKLPKPQEIETAKRNTPLVKDYF